MKRLFYVRHGETEMNVAAIWSGQIETPLTNNGRKQAKAAGVHIRDSEDFPQIDAIVCSPIMRAQHTAQIIADEIGYPVDKIILNELFVERAYGALEGTSYPEYYDNNTLEDMDDVEGAETLIHMHYRAIEAVEYLQSLPYDNVLVVSHGTFGRAVRRVINEIPHTHEYDEAHREKYRLGNAEIVELM